MAKKAFLVGANTLGLRYAEEDVALMLDRALPTNVARLVTTRSLNVAHFLDNDPVQLERLSSDDGLALLESRLHCHGKPAYRQDLQDLAALLEGHALALDIAAARIKNPRRLSTILHNLQKGIGRGSLNGLVIPDDEGRDANVELTLGLSYQLMEKEYPQQQRHFRALGAFAPEAPIIAEALGVALLLNFTYPLSFKSREANRTNAYRNRVDPFVDELNYIFFHKGSSLCLLYNFWTSLTSNSHFRTNYDAKGTESHASGIVAASMERGFCGQTLPLAPDKLWEKSHYQSGGRSLLTISLARSA